MPTRKKTTEVEFAKAGRLRTIQVEVVKRRQVVKREAASIARPEARPKAGQESDISADAKALAVRETMRRSTSYGGGGDRQPVPAPATLPRLESIEPGERGIGASDSPSRPKMELAKRLIFLSYRRQDSSGHAGRLHDRLAAHFGSNQVFMDVDNIDPGEDFIEVIRNSVWASEVLLLVIGPQWASVTSKDGGRRLDDPNDFVRLEVASARERKIRLVPVLVGGARMPDARDLPHALRPIARLHAAEVTDVRFHADAAKLIEAIEKLARR